MLAGRAADPVAVLQSHRCPYRQSNCQAPALLVRETKGTFNKLSKERGGTIVCLLTV